MPYREFTGKTVKEAVQRACEELNCEESLLEVEVLEESSKGFLGIVGQRDAHIKVKKRDLLKEIMEAGEPIAQPEKGTRASARTGGARRSERGQSTPDKSGEPSAEAPCTPEMEASLESAKTVLVEILKRMTVEAEVEARIVDAVVHLNIKGDGSGLLIGKKGNTLDALQSLVSKIVNKDLPTDKKIEVIVDTEGYRVRKRENLREKAMKMSQKAKKTLKPVWFDPMPPDERRIVHMILAEDREIYTKSHGEGAARRIVVYPRRAATNKRRGR